MTTLITGGTGFIGSHLARRLVQEGEQVVLFDRFPSSQRIADIEDRVTIVPGDVNELGELVLAMKRHRVQRVAHLAFAPGAVHPDKVIPYMRAQCIGTANVFEAARIQEVTRVANASSVAVFGFMKAGSRPSVGEEDQAAPNDLYGSCKLWGEHIAEFYNRNGMEILSLRICASLGYGRLDRASLAAGLTSERRNYMAAPELAVLGEPVTMPPDDEVVDIIYAADSAEAFRLALFAPRPEHSVFNLRAEQRPVGDLTHHLRRLLPDAEINVATERVNLIQLMDNERIVEELGFQPRYTLEAGIEEYIAHVREAQRRAGAAD